MVGVPAGGAARRVTPRALALATQRRALSDAWIAARLEEAARYARAQRQASKPEEKDEP